MNSNENKVQILFLPYITAVHHTVTSTLSSFASMVPEPSASNRSNASRISCFCSSVSSALGAVQAAEEIEGWGGGGAWKRREEEEWANVLARELDGVRKQSMCNQFGSTDSFSTEGVCTMSRAVED